MAATHSLLDMNDYALARKPIADLLYDLHDGNDLWKAPWARRHNMAHLHRTVDVVLALLDGQAPIYAEHNVDEETGRFELIVLSDDRLVDVSGTIDNTWPAATVIPRRELQALEVREIPHWSDIDGRDMREGLPGLSSESATVALEYGTLRVQLPMGPSGRRGALVAELLPSLVGDRLAPSA